MGLFESGGYRLKWYTNLDGEMVIDHNFWVPFVSKFEDGILLAWRATVMSTSMGQDQPWRWFFGFAPLILWYLEKLFGCNFWLKANIRLNAIRAENQTEDKFGQI